LICVWKRFQSTFSVMFIVDAGTGVVVSECHNRYRYRYQLIPKVFKINIKYSNHWRVKMCPMRTKIQK
jgi:hypothetical protein